MQFKLKCSFSNFKFQQFDSERCSTNETYMNIFYDAEKRWMCSTRLSWVKLGRGYMRVFAAWFDDDTEVIPSSNGLKILRANWLEMWVCFEFVWYSVIVIRHLLQLWIHSSKRQNFCLRPFCLKISGYASVINRFTAIINSALPRLRTKYKGFQKLYIINWLFLNLACTMILLLFEEP